jgi:hypothetical protein
LPNIDILTGVDGARKDMWESRLKCIEKLIIGVDPTNR